MSFRSARLAAGLSVRQVIEKLKVTDAAVYMWETGTQAPRASRLPEIAELYGCTVDELLKAVRGCASLRPVSLAGHNSAAPQPLPGSDTACPASVHH